MPGRQVSGKARKRELHLGWFCTQGDDPSLWCGVCGPHHSPPPPTHTLCQPQPGQAQRESHPRTGSELSVAFTLLRSLRRFETAAPCLALCWAEALGDKTVYARRRGAPALVWGLRGPSGCGRSLLNRSPGFWPGQRVKGGAGILFPWVCLLPGPLETV